jgi:putative membrane protein
MTADMRMRALRALAGLLVPALIAAGLFLWWPRDLYDWMKALHVLSVIGWMAGMLLLPALFVYHCRAEPRSRLSETFKLMEQRLLNLLINPAMVFAWAIGGWMIWAGDLFRAEWLQVKLALVFALSWAHGMLSAWTRRFAADANRHGEGFYRIVNGLIVLLTVATVLLAVVKPF